MPSPHAHCFCGLPRWLRPSRNEKADGWYASRSLRPCALHGLYELFILLRLEGAPLERLRYIPSRCQNNLRIIDTRIADG